MKRSRIHVSDHALLRYLELVKGIDVDAARAEIEAKTSFALEYDSPDAVLSHGFRYRLCEGKVVTVAPMRGGRK